MNTISINETNQLIIKDSIGSDQAIDLFNICRLQVTGHFVHIHLMEGEVQHSTEDKQVIEALINDHAFYKIHPYHLINKHHVKKIITGDEDTVVMYDGANLPLARRSKADFIAVMQDWAMQKMYKSIAV